MNATDCPGGSAGDSGFKGVSVIPGGTELKLSSGVPLYPLSAVRVMAFDVAAAPEQSDITGCANDTAMSACWTITLIGDDRVWGAPLTSV